MVYTTIGILHLDQSNAEPDALWGYLECCPDLGRYYRQMARFRFGDGTYLRLMRPAWGTHVTIIRREVPVTKIDLNTWIGREIELTYSNLITNTKHVWLDVQCDEMLDLREKMGLPRLPEIPLHITVGVMPGENLTLHHA